MRRYDWDGKSIDGLSRLIMESNYGKMLASALSRDKKALERGFKGVIPKRGSKTLTFPDAERIIESKSLSVKAREGGKLMTETRQKAVADAMRDAIKEAGVSTTRGTVPQNLGKIAEKHLRKAYAPYVKDDPKLGRPASIHRVAVTESRIMVNGARRAYATAAKKEINRAGYEWEREWQHNDGLSRDPRRTHKAMDGKKADKNGMYRLKGADGKTYICAGPHDSPLPGSEFATCNGAEKRRATRKK